MMERVAMALTEQQTGDVWREWIESEVRSLYFGDLASLYTRQKQWITGASFFLSSGAAAILVAKLPTTVPIVLSALVALMTAYAVAVNLASKIRTMAKLHYAWNQIGNDYERLWNHTYSDEAEAELIDLKRRASEISELATTDAPNDPKRMERWEDHVFRLKGLSNA
jgi:hypothetical protein